MGIKDNPIQVFNIEFLRKLEMKYGIGLMSEIGDHIDDGSTIVTDNMKIVDKPNGIDETEDYIFDYLKGFYVDQHTTNSDSYAGELYFKLEENQWLEVPYLC